MLYIILEYKIPFLFPLKSIANLFMVGLGCKYEPDY